MSYKAVEPLNDPLRQPDELRQLDLEQDISGDAMRPWTVSGIATIIVAMLVYGYTRLTSTDSAAPSRSPSTTTDAAPTLPTVNPTLSTPEPENR